MNRPETSFGARPWIQQHWDVRAAGNFMLGGAGAGLLVAAPLSLGAALVVFAIGASSFFLHEDFLRIALAAAALAFLFCQARILHGSKGIPAWRAPEVVPLIMLTGLAEGAGIALLFGDAGVLLGLFVLALLARALAWSRYRAALRQPRSAAALEPAGRSLLQLGTVLPIALLLFSTVAPEALWLAGLMAAATGWRLKFALVTRAAHNQGFSLPHLPTR